jgi:hypothetical protein
MPLMEAEDFMDEDELYARGLGPEGGRGRSEVTGY